MTCLKEIIFLVKENAADARNFYYPVSVQTKQLFVSSSLNFIHAIRTPKTKYPGVQNSWQGLVCTVTPRTGLHRLFALLRPLMNAGNKFNDIEEKIAKTEVYFEVNISFTTKVILTSSMATICFKKFCLKKIKVN